MKIYKPNFWNKKNNIMSILLLPISYTIQALFFLKKKLTRKKIFSIPIVCVGNIYLGGTGKTPMSMLIYDIMKERGFNPCIIKKSYADHNDEKNMIESKGKKLFFKPSRDMAIVQAENESFNIAILDDGLQDASIHKNLSIVCFNSKLSIGNGMTIPSGPLRESLQSVKNCQIALINGEINKDLENKILKIKNDIKIFYSNYKAKNIDNLKNIDFLAFAGIGNPESFFNLLVKNNLTIKKNISFPDHYNFKKEEIVELINQSRKNNLKLITTEKDYQRIKQFNLNEINYLSIDLDISNKKNFVNEINKHI